jgi:simple sugar transport system ATP-binding protein
MSVSAGAGQILLETRALSKHFGTLKANDGIDLAVRAGEIHAVLGENGAGKSTLMKLLYGYYQPTSGEVLIDGRPVVLESPRRGRAFGIGMVFQNFTLIPAFRVWENVALFLEGAGDKGQLVRKITDLSRSYGLNVNPLALVRDLPMGDRQKVEIVKILAAGARVLIFDEPTSVLAPHEAENLFVVFDRLRSEGYAVLFISHKMTEVLRCADRVTVLRKGRVAASLPREGLDRHGLVNLLVGQESEGEWEEVGARRSSSRGTAVLEFVNVSCLTDDGRPGLEGVSFTVLNGEVLGVAAVSGNGQEFLGDLVLGLRQPTGGSVFLEGVDRDRPTPRKTLASGVAVLPEDPLRQGTIGTFTVKENLILGRQNDYWTDGGWTPDRSRWAHDAQASLMEAFVQSPPRLEARAGDLSGGNLQRVVIARELRRSPRLFVSYYLTRGLDLSNARAARDLVLDHVDKGMGALFVSEDLDELFAISDRLLVIHAGKAVGLFPTKQTTQQEVGLLMTGAGGSHD